MWHAIGLQFRNPTGLGGRVMGHVMRAINRRPNHEAIAALAINPGDCVLDLGCGPGDAIVRIRRLATRNTIVGVDQSQIMIDQAARRNSKAITDGGVVLHRATFDDLPLPNASVDKVLAVNVAYFWNDMPAVLAEIARVLRPGGALAVYVTDAAVMRRWKFAGPQTHRLFDEAALRSALSAEPFSGIIVSEVAAGAGVTGLVAVARKTASDYAASPRVKPQET